MEALSTFAARGRQRGGHKEPHRTGVVKILTREALVYREAAELGQWGSKEGNGEGKRAAEAEAEGS